MVDTDSESSLEQLARYFYLDDLYLSIIKKLGSECNRLGFALYGLIDPGSEWRLHVIGMSTVPSAIYLAKTMRWQPRTPYIVVWTYSQTIKPPFSAISNAGDRVEKIIPCTPEQCVCAQCGNQKELIGYESSEQLDVEPAKHFVLVTKREKRACRRCAELGVETAAAPARIIPKSLASDRVIIDTIVNKYCAHLPLFRQSAILERETGLQLSRVTLCGWVMAVGELLMPIVGAMRRELLSGGYIQADETPVDVQSERTKGKNHQAYLWQYSRPDGPVVFDFQLDRGRQGLRQFLGEFAGILQTDGYTGYGKVGGKAMVHAGCWAHARRYFFQAVQLNKRDLLALGIVAEIDKLFELEAQAKAAGLGTRERLELRREKAEPIVEGLKEGIESARASTLPRSALGKACDYALGRWGQLRRFLDYAQLELSNNLAENAIRPVAVGRNYEQSGIRQSSLSLERKKFACLLRGGRVNAGEVLRASDSHARHGLVFISPQMGLPSDGG